MTATLLGRLDWNLRQTDEGHRNYSIEWLVEVDTTDDGPQQAFNCPGLAAIGSWWQYGNDNDSDAFCQPEAEIRPFVTKERSNLYTVRQNFSTNPFGGGGSSGGGRSQEVPVGNPLAEPYRISGSTNRYTYTSTVDKDNRPIKTSSLELLEEEFDENRATIDIGFNTLILPTIDFSPIIDCVNDSALWGFNKRCVKVTAARWARQVYGNNFFYFTVDYSFEIRHPATFDRWVADSGTRCLRGHSPGSLFKNDPLDPEGTDVSPPTINKSTPKAFEAYIDAEGNNTRVFLDGDGRPVDDIEDALSIQVTRYPEANLLVLGIPSAL